MLMVMSALYYGLDDTEKVEVNGLKFMDTGEGWLAHNNDARIMIWSDPREVESYGVDISGFESLTKVYLSVDPSQNLKYAVNDLERNFGFEQLALACYEDSELCKEMPLKTCEDVTTYIGVIILREANETKVSLDGNCLIIEGEDLLKIVDGMVVENEGK